jgi:hypothetical protein
MGMNHKVVFRTEEQIAKIAQRCWQLYSRERRFNFNVVGFILEVLVTKGIDLVVTTRGRKKGKLALKFFDREFVQDDPAYVGFDPKQRDNYVTLFVDNKIWADAKAGLSYACEILAHEIGHVLLHDHYANAFSTDSDGQKLFAGTSKEDFAEWQAITFSGHLMIPTHVAQKFDDPRILAAATNAPEKLVNDRLVAVRNIKKVLNPIYEGDICDSCSNFTLVREGRATRCNTCGSEAQS